MIVLRHTVTALLNGRGSVPDLLRAGFGQDWLADQVSCGESAEDKLAYAFILKHHAEYGNVPSLAIFHKSFPEVSFRLEGTESVAELIPLLQEDRDYVVSLIALTDIAEATEQKDYAQVRQVAEKLLKATAPVGSSLSLLSLDDIDELPDPEPLIDGVLDARTVTMLSGPSGKGKSFIALDWALSLAGGSPWLDHKAEARRVLYVAAEGGHGQKMRVRAWREGHRDAASPDENVRFIVQPVQVGEPDELRELLGAARHFDVIIIDTLAKVAVGLEENSAKDMGQFIAALYKLRDAMADGEGGTVILVHHTGYNTARARGSSAIQAGVDNAISVEAEEPAELMTIKCAKRKDSEPFRSITARLVKCGPSAVVEEIEGQLEQAQKYGDRAHALVDWLSENKWPTERAMAETLGMPRSSLQRLVQDLVGQGRIVKGPGGKPQLPLAQ